MFEPLPEWFKSVRTLAVANENHRTRFHIQNHCQILMTFTNGDLINGDGMNIFQTRIRELVGQIPFLDFLDYVPGDSQVSGHISDRHMFRQIQSITFKSMGIRKAGISKSERCLANIATAKTTDTLDLKIEKYDFGAHGNRPESPHCRSSHYDLPTFTNRTTQLLFFTTDRESNVSVLISRTHIIVANKAKSMVQKTCGHASPPIIGNLRQFPFGVVCPFFSTTKSMHQPDEPKK